MRESKVRETLRMYKTAALASTLALFLLTKNSSFSYIFLFVLVQTALGGGMKVALKHVLPKHIWQRPRGAVNCSGFYRSSNKVNSMGFPSGHAMGAFALATLAADYSNYDLATVAFSYGLAAMVALSRGTFLGRLSAGGHGGKEVACHSSLQIVVGSLTGIAYALIVIRRFPPPWKKTKKNEIKS